MAHIETELLYERSYRDDAVNIKHPEAFPYYPATAFTMKSMEEVKKAYSEGYTYIRTRNPDRDVVAGLVNALEAPNSEEYSSCVFGSGMAAITTALAAVLRPGDHAVCNSFIYGETLEVWQDFMMKFGVDVSFVDMSDGKALLAAVKPETKLFYTEVCANPTVNVTDIAAVADVAHAAGAMLMVDNTFTTPFAVRPLSLGADIVISSMTKFLSGHSDILLGCLTAKKETVEKIGHFAMIMGTPADPYPCYQMIRALQTASLRVERQMSNAAKLAAFFENDPRIAKVHHPSVESFATRAAAKRMFASDERMTGMMSVDFISEDYERLDRFVSGLRLVHYAPTLGGMRTTLSHPCTSSHSNMDDASRRAIGITPATMRISVGIENIEDLKEDFAGALRAYE